MEEQPDFLLTWREFERELRENRGRRKNSTTTDSS
jgi:hypothetical protein